MSYQLLVSAFYIGITKVILVWFFFILMEQKVHVSGTPCAQLYFPTCCQKLHMPLQNVPITMAASLLEVMSSLNRGKRNTMRELAQMFLSCWRSMERKELPWWMHQHCQAAPPQKLLLLFISLSKSLAEVGMSPDTRGVISMRTSLWQALSKHTATQAQGVWSTMSDKALSTAKFFGQQTESRSSVVAAPDMPQAAFPLRKAKTAQEKEQDGKDRSSLPMPFPPSPAPCLWQCAQGVRLSTKKSKGRGQMHPVTCCTQSHSRHWAPRGPSVLV